MRSQVITYSNFPEKLMMDLLTKNRLKLSYSKALSPEIKVLYFFDLQLWPRGQCQGHKIGFKAKIARQKGRRQKQTRFS